MVHILNCDLQTILEIFLMFEKFISLSLDVGYRQQLYCLSVNRPKPMGSSHKILPKYLLRDLSELYGGCNKLNNRGFANKELNEHEIPYLSCFGSRYRYRSVWVVFATNCLFTASIFFLMNCKNSFIYFTHPELAHTNSRSGCIVTNLLSWDRGHGLKSILKYSKNL